MTQKKMKNVKKQKRPTILSMSKFSLGKRPLETADAKKRREEKMNGIRERRYYGAKIREEARRIHQVRVTKKNRIKNKLAHKARIQFKFPSYA